MGLTGQFVSMVESGKSGLTEANIRLICLTYNVNNEWLREGKGDMFDYDTLLSSLEKQLLELFRKLSFSAQKAFLEYVEKLVAIATRWGSPSHKGPRTHDKAPGAGISPGLKHPPCPLRIEGWRFS
jgi:hypothetical protein